VRSGDDGRLAVAGYLTARHLAREYGAAVFDRPADEVQAYLLMDDVIAQYETDAAKKVERNRGRRR